MTGTLYQEDAFGRYVKHPPAYEAAAPGADGWPLDAGTAIIVSSNTGRLVKESKRHLLWSTGTGQSAPLWSTTSAPWSGLPGNPTANPTQIPWDRRTARRFPVLTAIEDETNADGEPRQRKIQMTVRALLGTDASTTDSRVFFAITPGPSPGQVNSLARVGAAVKSSVVSTVGEADYTVTFTTADFGLPFPVAPPVRSRADSTNGPAYSRLMPLWLWFGWRFVSSGTDYCGPISFSAFEMVT